MIPRSFISLTVNKRSTTNQFKSSLRNTNAKTSQSQVDRTFLSVNDQRSVLQHHEHQCIKFPLKRQNTQKSYKLWFSKAANNDIGSENYLALSILGPPNAGMLLIFYRRTLLYLCHSNIRFMISS